MNEGYYKHEGKISKQDLDIIDVGDLVKINNWVQAYRVVAKSDTHIILIRKYFNSFAYVIIEKVCGDKSEKCFIQGKFKCGADNRNCAYNYYDIFECKEALKRLSDGLREEPEFNLAEINFWDWKKAKSKFVSHLSKSSKEHGTLKLSPLNSINIETIYFKRTEYNEQNIQNWVNKTFCKKIIEVKK